MSASMLRVHGTVASPGLAEGPLYFLDDEPASVRTFDALPPAEAFEAALGQAIAEIEHLGRATLDENARALLEFQVAMLEDESLLEPARAALREGLDAGAAWRRAIELQLAQFESAEDPYFRARSADLEDMRERVLRCLAGARAKRIPPGAIVVARDLVPSRFLETDWQGGGIALSGGSAKSHVAMLARSRGVPMLIGTPPWDPNGHREALLDTEAGTLIVSPATEVRAAFARRLAGLQSAKAAADSSLSGPAVTQGGQVIKVMINIADVGELARLDPAHCDGIGLVRTELLLKSRAELGDEEGQYAAYCSILRWARGAPVTIRTLDAGSDKPIPGYTVEESNPFLGTRGVPVARQSRALCDPAARLVPGGPPGPAAGHGADGDPACGTRGGQAPAR